MEHFRGMGAQQNQHASFTVPLPPPPFDAPPNREAPEIASTLEKFMSNFDDQGQSEMKNKLSSSLTKVIDMFQNFSNQVLGELKELSTSVNSFQGKSEIVMDQVLKVEEDKMEEEQVPYMTTDEESDDPTPSISEPSKRARSSLPVSQKMTEESEEELFGESLEVPDKTFKANDSSEEPKEKQAEEEVMRPATKEELSQEIEELKKAMNITSKPSLSLRDQVDDIINSSSKTLMHYMTRHCILAYFGCLEPYEHDIPPIGKKELILDLIEKDVDDGDVKRLILLLLDLYAE